MFNEILEYSQQPYMMVWTALFVILGILTIVSLIFGELFDIDFDTDTDLDISVEGGGHGFLHSVGSFMDLGHVPITFLLFMFATLNWGIGITLNSYINTSHNTLFGFLLLIPVFFGSFFVTKIVNIPVKKLYKAMNGDNEVKNKVLGNFCTTTTQVSETNGQAEIETGTSPLKIMVYTDDESLEKGVKAVVLSFNKKTNRYLIAKL
ncbi:MAG: DUF1449 family protein [Lentisphaeraceae bacterium]|nr:DUF1449 family protein [Lentisphaeraceae bacterium]